MVLAIDIDSPREYVRVVYILSGVTKLFIKVQRLVVSTKLTATRDVNRFL